MRLTTFAVLAMLAAAAPLAAQTTTQTNEPVPFTDRWHPIGGLHFGTPTRVSLSVGLLRPLGENSRHALLALVEPGLDGGKVRAGYAFAGPLGTALSVQGGALRTWSNPVNADTKRTYAGGEVRLVFILLNAGVGYYVPTSGSGSRVFWSIGLGL